jgi:hypothetical protein
MKLSKTVTAMSVKSSLWRLINPGTGAIPLNKIQNTLLNFELIMHQEAPAFRPVFPAVNGRASKFNKSPQSPFPVFPFTNG